LRRFAAAGFDVGSAPAEPFESTTMAWWSGTWMPWPALPSSLKPSVAAVLMMLKRGLVLPCVG
jgi:hypothetical protein